MVIDGTQYANWSREIFLQMRAGGVAAVHATLVYHETAREALRVIGRWQRLFEENGDLIAPVETVDDIERANDAGQTGIIFGFQNPSPIEDDIDLVETFYKLGVRFMQLTYNNQSLLASGCYEESDGGVTRFGRQVIGEMNRVGMVIDMSHSGERSTLEAIKLSERPICISHANPARWHSSRRNKSDRVLEALADSSGLLGLSLYPFHLRSHSQTTLADFCQMVARTAEWLGIERIGLGSDLCQDQPAAILDWMRTGRWSKTADFGEGSAASAGWPRPVNWFKSNADFPKIEAGLRAIGFSEGEARLIMGGNWRRFLAKSWGPAA